jgi:general secretion pathway protein K
MARSQQRGLALVTAMLVVAIVATVATYLSFRQQVWLRQVQNTTDRATVESVRQGALAYASLYLDEDLRNTKTDNLREKWAQPLVLPIEGGQVAIQAGDAQARFNLNNVLRNNAPSAADIGVFQRLLASLKFDPGLADALIDWIDADSQSRPNGGEDIEYGTASPPYRTGNQLLQSVDELRLVKGFTRETVEALRPFVIALPTATEINVNTASEPVLAALFPAAGDTIAKQIVQSRETKPFDDLAEFDRALPPGTTPPQVPRGIATSYFVADVDVRVGRLWSRTEAVINRIGNKQTRALWQRARPIQITADEDKGS